MGSTPTPPVGQPPIVPPGQPAPAGPLKPASPPPPIPAFAVREHPLLPGSWEVSENGPNAGEVYLALFGGTDAQRLAEEYATWKRSSSPTPNPDTL